MVSTSASTSRSESTYGQNTKNYMQPALSEIRVNCAIIQDYKTHIRHPYIVYRTTNCFLPCNLLYNPNGHLVTWQVYIKTYNSIHHFVRAWAKQLCSICNQALSCSRVPNQNTNNWLVIPLYGSIDYVTLHARFSSLITIGL